MKGAPHAAATPAGPVFPDPEGGGAGRLRRVTEAELVAFAHDQRETEQEARRGRNRPCARRPIVPIVTPEGSFRPSERSDAGRSRRKGRFLPQPARFGRCRRAGGRERPDGRELQGHRPEAHSDVGFAVVLLTPTTWNARKVTRRNRARQNVILELGYFVGRLSCERVCVLRPGDVEIPSDFGGVVYEPFDPSGGWKSKLAKELEAAEYAIDWAKVQS
jgi:hypothetical protein